uniref:Transmembrane protein n=1 Tax=Medicago truncatula TaxID=3880 RepID=I3T4H3_MEDTR|nr:unknown [Medicago truncatula]
MVTEEQLSLNHMLLMYHRVTLKKKHVVLLIPLFGVICSHWFRSQRTVKK